MGIIKNNVTSREEYIVDDMSEYLLRHEEQKDEVIDILLGC